jgi:transposase
MLVHAPVQATFTPVSKSSSLPSGVASGPPLSPGRSGITLLLLPAYSPELNPVENLWHYIRSHYLSNRIYDNYNELLEAGTTAYRRLTQEIIKSVCACTYLEERAD